MMVFAPYSDIARVRSANGGHGVGIQLECCLQWPVPRPQHLYRVQFQNDSQPEKYGYPQLVRDAPPHVQNHIGRFAPYPIKLQVPRVNWNNTSVVIHKDRHFHDVLGFIAVRAIVLICAILPRQDPTFFAAYRPF